MNPVEIIGCGPGHKDYLSLAACAVVKKAEVLVGAPHLLQLFPDLDCQRFPVRGSMTKVLDEISGFRDKRVCVLVSGDTGLYSLARLVIDRFGRQNCRLTPGISSLQLACSRLALDWHDLPVYSVHGRIPQIDLATLGKAKKMAFLAGDKTAVDWLVQQWELMEENYSVVSCENLSLETERIQFFDRSSELKKAALPSRTILFFLKEGVLT
ncbi:precorrin-6Y C5,15-methyltransferase (decarboxylating) [Desulfuromusa kysingii]|uniref:Precorrin-6Y C5,15-methyltransferase (Decarboxylating) n=1 Tax=Desulfuromusa kysingii TaxID=37625 RepID=A0A1H4AIH5_9BACT|nr:precorrin-6y C5,15-methyltransferase (decarboxylating) subunit CbiE [Desulfuromusa kysingii]SEA35541.1 precorrin-6Y C5,15-methyltransferase (decarboxylating) [Desulfuromusa kysingii]